MIVRAIVLIGIGAVLIIGSVYLDRAHASCDASGTEQLPCEKNFYRTMVAEEGAARALENIERRFAEDAFIQSHCHALAHEIGYAAMDTYPTLAGAYAEGSPFCWDGYYHGVVERMVTRDGRDAAESALPSVCNAVGADTGKMFDFEACTHGVGHAASVLYGELTPSLQFCATFADGRPRQACYAGVFMAHRAEKPVASLSPLYPCDAVTAEYAPHCFPYQMAIILTRMDNDFSRAFQECELVSEATSRHACRASVGRAAVLKQPDVAQNGAEAVCGLPRDIEAQLDCYTGAAKQIVRLYRSTDVATEFCAMVPETFREACLTTTVRQYEEISSLMPR